MGRVQLVTGGAGFIGANYVHHVLAHQPEDRVVVLDKLTYAGNLDNLLDVDDDPRYAFVQGDICDADAVAEALKTSAIEGERLSRESVRSSVARRLGLPSAGLPVDRHTDGHRQHLQVAQQRSDFPHCSAVRGGADVLCHCRSCVC